MEWVSQAAAWLREVLALPWLDAWQPHIAKAPDWALLAAGPVALLLIALLLRLTWRARPGSGANSAAKMPPRSARKKPGPPAPSPPQANADEPPTKLAAVSPAHAAKQGAAPVKDASPAIIGDTQEPATASHQTIAAPVRRTSGVPDDNEQERKARVFLSSTFRDMRAEREVLATDTFPSLKRKFRARGIEVQEVDLRWGVNEGDATLDVCLQAVRRSNWFVGLIGQRYGTTLEDLSTVALLGQTYPSVREGLGRSLTEIEILEGVLLNAKGKKHTLFFERDEKWLDRLGPAERYEHEEQVPETRAKLADLKTRIHQHVGAMHVYASPQEIDAVFEHTLSEALEKAFPLVESSSDPFTQEHRLHAAYARERIGLYIGGDEYIGTLNAGVEGGGPPQIVVGDSGGGKSALLANWVQRWCVTHPRDLIFAHYLGASPESARPAALVRRLWQHLNAVMGEETAPPGVDATDDDLRDALLDLLGQANAFASREDCRIIIALDGLDKLAEDQRDLRWWPRVLPPRVRLVVSSLEGKARDAGRERGWSEHLVKPFDATQQGHFIAETLRGWNKSDFPDARRQRVLAHELAGLPLFLKTILEELRISATNDVLDTRLDNYLKAPDMPDLFSRILAQIESECGRDFVAQAMSLVWASRAGLEEDEIVAIASETQHKALGPAGLAWERLRNRLADNLRDRQRRVAFSHDYLRQAVGARYLEGEEVQRRAHLVIADRFAMREPDDRLAEELPYQLRAAAAWERLEALLIDLDRFTLLRTRGDSELLSHWLPLKALGRDTEELLCSAFVASRGEAEQWTRADSHLALTLGNFLRFAGATGYASQRLGERCSAACESLFGPEHSVTLTSMLNLASTLHARGDLEGARELFERVLKARSRLLGPEHPDTLTSMGNFAATLRDRGDLAGAQHYEERALEARTRILGSEHPSTLTNMGTLASTLKARGNLEGAQYYEERVRETRTRLLGPEHPDTLMSMLCLASTLRARGDLESAQHYEERVLEAMMRVLGPEHPETLASMGNLARTLSARGDLEGAQRYEERVLEAMIRLLGPEHPKTLTVMGNFASTLRARGDLAGAQRYGERVLDATIRLFGPEHPDTLTSMGDLASTLMTRGDLERAQHYEERALEAMTRVLGSEHPHTLTTMGNLARTLSARGNLGRAQYYEERVLEGNTRLLGPEHPATLTSMGNLASTLFACGELERAQQYEEQVLAARARLLGPEHPDTLTGMVNLASTLSARGDLERTQHYEERLLKAYTRLRGREHLDTLTIMGNLAMTLHDRDDLEGAQHYGERALEALVRLLGPEHPDTLTIMGNLAKTLRARGYLEGAQQYEERVLQANTRLLGPEHPDTLSSMLNLASTLNARGDLEGALHRAEHVLAVATRRLGGEHPMSKNAFSWVVGIRGAIAKRTKP